MEVKVNDPRRLSFLFVVLPLRTIDAVRCCQVSCSASVGELHPVLLCTIRTTAVMISSVLLLWCCVDIQ